MKLGSYQFIWTPDRFTIPHSDKITSSVLTWESVGFFSWGMHIIGKKIECEWKWMQLEDYEEIRKIVNENQQKVWDLEATNRLYYESPIETLPLIAGQTLTGIDSAAIGTIESVNRITQYIEFSNITSLPIIGERMTNVPRGNSIVVKYFEIYPNYNVNILDFYAKYFENLRTDFQYREDVRLDLIIMSETWTEIPVS